MFQLFRLASTLTTMLRSNTIHAIFRVTPQFLQASALSIMSCSARRQNGSAKSDAGDSHVHFGAGFEVSLDLVADFMKSETYP